MAASSWRKKNSGRALTPTRLQMEAVECGAASLGIMLAYYGRYVPLADLRRECGVSRDGSKASNIVKVAQSYGLDASGYSKSLESIQELATPFIVFWDFNHFLVVEGFKGDTVFLNDPAIGHRQVSLEEFDRSFTGVVLTMTPGEEFQTGGRAPNMYDALCKRLQGLHGAIFYGIGAGFLLVIPGIAIPVFSQVFLDSIIIDGYVDWLRPLLLVMGLALLLQTLVRFLQLRYLRRLYVVLSVRLAGQFMWHLLRLPATFYAQRYAGEVANRSHINNHLARMMSGRLAQTVIDTVMVVFYAAVMLIYDWLLATIVITIACINVLVLRRISKRRTEANMKLLQEEGKAEGVAIAALQGMETLKSMGQESDFFKRWSGYYARSSNARQDLELDNQALSVLPPFLTSLMLALLLIVGGMRIIDGHLTIGMLIAFQLIMLSFVSPINNLMNLGMLLQELKGDMERLDDVLDNPVQEQGDDSIEAGSRLRGDIELKDITFGYSPLESPLLKNLSLSVKAGQRIALVGASGSGKTTLSKIISGEYRLWSGQVLFDDTPLQTIPKSVLVDSFSEVAQEILLFEGSVRDNLTLWDNTISEEELIVACKDADIHDTIVARPGGYDSLVREGGSNFSGGQRQRLEIARALVHRPNILVMDEATSALDAETELYIVERLRRRNCTCVVVSHRLSTIRDCDEIIVLEHGQIVERGTHAQLWSEQGAYTRLLKLQDADSLEADNV